MNRPLLHAVCPSCGAVNRVPQDRPAREAKCGRCHQPLFTGKPVAAGAEGFERHIARNDIPVLVDFWAPWCGPCQAMAPAFERAAAELEPRFRLLKVNADDVPAIVARYGVRSIPTLMLFAAGRPVAQTAGAMDSTGILSWVRAHEAEARAAEHIDHLRQRADARAKQSGAGKDGSIQAEGRRRWRAAPPLGEIAVQAHG